MNQEVKERSPAVKPAATPSKDLISHQLVKYLEERGVEYVFGLCGHTNIAVLAALVQEPNQVHQYAARAGRCAHG